MNDIRWFKYDDLSKTNRYQSDWQTDYYAMVVIDYDWYNNTNYDYEINFHWFCFDLSLPNLSPDYVLLITIIRYNYRLNLLSYNIIFRIVEI